MLYIVATPIGHPKDITLRALEVLQKADYIIGEEKRVASTFLKKLDLSYKPLFLLNEHSQESDLKELTSLCENSEVALISDCGTPSFYDPGYQLVQKCRSKKISMIAVPGASSLMVLLSLVSQKVTQFYFAGFLPADTTLRLQTFKKIQNLQEPLVFMDTPYRLIKVLEELNRHFSGRTMLLGLNLTQEQERVFEGTPDEIITELKKQSIEKAEFIALIYKKVGKENSHPKTPMKKRRKF